MNEEEKIKEEKEKKVKVVMNPKEANERTEPLKVNDLDKDLQDRISRIRQEFIDGLAFIKKHKKSVTFFGSARLQPGNPDFEKAKSVAAKIAEAGFDVITGGGPGIMEAANCGAFSSKGPGKSLGMNIELPMEQILNQCVHEYVNFYYFFSRKVSLTFSAEAYLFFPGGFGTMDEFFEILTLVQTRKIERVPIILVGTDYWKHIDSFIKETLLEEYKTIDEEDPHWYKITDDEEEILEIVKHAKLRDE